MFEEEEETDETGLAVTPETLSSAGALYLDPKTGRMTPYVTSPELYQQMKKDQQRQVLVGGAAAAAAEVAQFGIGVSAFLDPAVDYSRQRLAELRALEKRDAPGVSAGEEAMAPVMTGQTAIQQRTEKLLASRPGGGTVREYLQAREAGLGEVRRAAVGAEAEILTEEERRSVAHEKKQKEAREEADPIEHMMFRMRQEYLREPVSQFLGDAMKLFGKAYAYAPVPEVEDIVDQMRTKGMNEEDISEVAKTARNPRHARRMMKKLIAQAKQRPSVVDVDTRTEPEKKPEIQYPEGVELGEEGYVTIPGGGDYEFKYDPESDTWTARSTSARTGQPPNVVHVDQPHNMWMNRGFTDEAKTFFAEIKKALKPTETPSE